MITVYNPTNERFDMVYAGISVTLMPDEFKEFDVPAANHLLNTYGPRGLTALKFGCDKEAIAEQGRERNLAFKKKMVTDFNQRNEARKQMGLGYTPPDKKMKEYAIELGVQLFEPYSMHDAERGAIADLSKKNNELEHMVLKLLNKLEEVMGAKEAEKKPIGRPPKGD